MIFRSLFQIKSYSRSPYVERRFKYKGYRAIQLTYGFALGFKGEQKFVFGITLEDCLKQIEAGIPFPKITSGNIIKDTPNFLSNRENLSGIFRSRGLL